MMPGIPLPFVIALLLCILLLRLVRQGEVSLRPAIVFIAACAVMTLFVGLRWSLDIRAIRFLQPIIASTLPPLAWYCFSGLAGRGDIMRFRLHAVPVIIVAVLSATWPLWHPPVDVVLALTFFGYGIALLALAWRGPDALAATRLSDAARAHRAMLLAGLALLASGIVDLVVAGDFGFYQGAHAAVIVGYANMATLPLIAWAVASAGSGVAEPDAQPVAVTVAAPTTDDAKIIEAIDTLIRKKQLFRDPDLTLNRLARKAQIPSRQISAAINRVLGRNVSQVINEYRIEEAKRLLASTDLAITAVIFEAGFQTKSNFNREFLRVTGMSPSDYRRSNPSPVNESEPALPEAPLPERR